MELIPYIETLPHDWATAEEGGRRVACGDHTRVAFRARKPSFGFFFSGEAPNDGLLVKTKQRRRTACFVLVGDEVVASLRRIDVDGARVGLMDDRGSCCFHIIGWADVVESLEFAAKPTGWWATPSWSLAAPHARSTRFFLQAPSGLTALIDGRRVGPQDAAANTSLVVVARMLRSSHGQCVNLVASDVVIVPQGTDAPANVVVPPRAPDYAAETRAAGDETYDAPLPQEFTCPISYAAMAHPVRCDGQWYDCGALKAWFRVSHLAPLTRKHVDVKATLSGVHAPAALELKAQIDAWRAAHVVRT